MDVQRETGAPTDATRVTMGSVPSDISYAKHHSSTTRRDGDGRAASHPRVVIPRRTGQPDYVYKARREGAWTKVTLDTPAPEKASAVVMQLYLSNSPQGTVWWDDISLEQIAAPAPRKITVASINLKPSNTKSAAESVRQFLSATDASVHGNTDVILFPEGI